MLCYLVFMYVCMYIVCMYVCMCMYVLLPDSSDDGALCDDGDVRDHALLELVEECLANGRPSLLRIGTLRRKADA